MQTIGRTLLESLVLPGSLFFLLVCLYRFARAKSPTHVHVVVLHGDTTDHVAIKNGFGRLKPRVKLLDDAYRYGARSATNHPACEPFEVSASRSETYPNWAA